MKTKKVTAQALRKKTYKISKSYKKKSKPLEVRLLKFIALFILVTILMPFLFFNGVMSAIEIKIVKPLHKILNKILNYFIERYNLLE